MTVIFVSNYFNHHQKPFSDSMYSILGDGYKFISTAEIGAERMALGWGTNDYPLYVISKKEFCCDLNKYQQIIDDADIVITGSAPHFLMRSRVRQEKIVFQYSERLLKNGYAPWEFLPRLIKWRRKIKNSQSTFLLSSSAYAASDYAKFGLFKNKAFKWGYFPETRRYNDVDSLIESKKPCSLLWVARFLALKHPEAPVEIARRLKNDGYSFTLDLIGNGVLEDKIHQMIVDYDLSDCVHLLGSMKPDEVRDHMEKSEIFLFTSDRHEGWGAVLNESMNSGCAVVASHAIGSVPFLVKDKENGFIYKDGNIDDLYEKVKYLLDNPPARREMSKKAYLTIADEWNAENAAKKFIELAENILNGDSCPVSEDGICSKAEILKDNWYTNE